MLDVLGMDRAQLAEQLRGTRGFAHKPQIVEAALYMLAHQCSSRKACAAVGIAKGSHSRVAQLKQRIMTRYNIAEVVEEREPKKFLDLFTGSGSVTKVAIDAGCDSRSLDDGSEGVHSPHGVTYQIDILKWDYQTALTEWVPDIIWASPLCTEYSDGKTKGERNIRHANKLVRRTIEIIKFVQSLRASRSMTPLTYVLENPDGKKKFALKNQVSPQTYAMIDDECE